MSCRLCSKTLDAADAVKPCACVDPVHRKCFEGDTVKTWPAKHACDVCNEPYKFKYPRIRRAVAFTPYLTIPGLYLALYLKMDALAPMVLGACAMAGIAMTVAQQRGAIISVGGRDRGPVMAFAVGSLVALAAPLMMVGAVHVEVMSWFPLLA